MPYCMYLRKSRSDVTGESIETVLYRHEQELLRLAARQGLSVTHIYREVVSGETIASRPEMQKLLASVESGAWEGVLVMEVERLARGDTIDQGVVAQAFQFSDTKIITPAKTYDPRNEYDEEYFEFALFMSRREYKTINRRQQAGRRAAVMEGKWPYNRAPFGYCSVRSPAGKGYILEQIPEKAAVVRMIFDLFTGKDGEQLGVTRIVRRLNALSIPSASGQDWTNYGVRFILDNPVYAGFVKLGGRPQVKTVEDGRVVRHRPKASLDDMLLVRGLHEPIIPDEQWQQTRKLRDESSRPSPGPKEMEMKNPLSGLIKCSKCGRAMTRRPYAGTTTRDSLLCYSPSCDMISAPLEDVEQALLSSLRELLEDLLSEQAGSASVPDATAELAALANAAQSRLAGLEAQRRRAFELVEQGVYSTEIFLERSTALAAQLSDAQAQLDALQAELNAARSAEDSRRSLIPRLRHVLETYDTAPTPAAKNDLLRTVLRSVGYLKTERSTRTRVAPFELTLFPLF